MFKMVLDRIRFHDRCRISGQAGRGHGGLHDLALIHKLADVLVEAANGLRTRDSGKKVEENLTVVQWRMLSRELQKLQTLGPTVVQDKRIKPVDKVT